MGLFLLTKRDTDFAAIMRAQRANVRQALRRRGIRGADLDDLTQTVFLVAFENPEKLPEDLERRAAWFAEVAKRRAREFHGAPWNRRIDRVDSDELARLAGKSRSNTEAPAMLAEMLDRLPERYHEIMRLRAQGYSIDDIAKHYGIPWAIAKYRWDRACVAMGARS